MSIDESSPEYRKRQLILSPEVVEALYQWHSGMDAVYALASTGHENLVSMSMIDRALSLLERDLKKVRHKPDREHLENLIGELQMIQMSPREFSAQEAGMDIAEDEYEYDRMPNKRSSRRPKRSSRRRR